MKAILIVLADFDMKKIIWNSLPLCMGDRYKNTNGTESYMYYVFSSDSKNWEQGKESGLGFYCD